MTSACATVAEDNSINSICMCQKIPFIDEPTDFSLLQREQLFQPPFLSGRIEVTDFLHTVTNRRVSRDGRSKPDEATPALARERFPRFLRRRIIRVYRVI